MDFRFGLGQHAEDRHRAILDAIGERRGAPDDLADVAQMTLGLHGADFHVKLQRGNAAYQLASRGQPIAVKRQRCERRPQLIEAGPRVEHRTGDHVAAESGKRIEVS